jgi:6,7-dimethyl-8-ribityllumazine synthase
MPTLNVQNIPGTFNVAIVVSRYNGEITQKLLDGVQERLQELGFTKERLTIIWVPGAVEIPLAAQRLARTGKYEAIILFGRGYFW